MNHGNKETNKKISRFEQMLVESPCLALYAKDKENLGTTDESKTGLGIT